ncbi:hypothetical protein CEXT_149321 [Caerostris extrusa]|uniref:Uncharacterized protein n=1 Tax=Caerostris extrusa TaxID=172846 RepID=A0AAV4XZ08_CAEEX|nr:hypothetical protein CEXT_149321 [Caerostris extrusa]
MRFPSVGIWQHLQQAAGLVLEICSGLVDSVLEFSTENYMTLQTEISNVCHGEEGNWKIFSSTSGYDGKMHRLAGL